MTIRQGDNRPIGVFDSGLGGLTAVTSLAELMPEERFIYFGDTARTPYGSKAVDTIQRFSIEIADFLLKHDAKIIVIACNTISATCLDVLNERFPGIPIIGIIEPAVHQVVEECAGQRVGVIGTKVTIFSRQYEKLIQASAPTCKVFSRACPLFVPAIEEGLQDTEVMESIVRHYMDDFVTDNALDALILGCTHYPLVGEVIRRLYPTLKIINPSKVVAQEVLAVLERYRLQALQNPNENQFYASDLSENFIKMAKSINPNKEVSVKLKKFER